MTNINIPADQQFIENLILQRTGPFISYGGAGALNQWFARGDKAQLFDFLAKNNFLQRFLQDTINEISEEAHALIGELPADCFNSMVSIGPGNGILELVLMKKTAAKSILLIDIETSDTHLHGYNLTGSGYASLEATRSFLVSNGVASESIMACNPRLEKLPEFRFHLLLSILSMGFHYPCDEYADFISKNCRPGGFVVFDKRRGIPDSGFDALGKSFHMSKKMAAQKHDRIFLTKYTRGS
jgi:hypothetical protein